MSSIPEQEHLDPADLSMLRDVLRAGGFRGVEAEADSDAKHAASVFVHAEFHKGMRTKKALLFALQNRSNGLPNVPQAADGDLKIRSAERLLGGQ